MKTNHQKALIYTASNQEPMQLIDINPIPKPEKNKLLVEVISVSLNPIDYKLPSTIGILAKNRIVGHDFSGKVIHVPNNMNKFRIGDDVFGMIEGSLAQIISVDPEQCILKPPELSFQQAAGLPFAGQTALQSLRSIGQITPGESDVLVIGASGGCGYLGVQISKILGAKSVTGVCSQKNFDFVKSLGADFVHDYNSQYGKLPRNKKFDLIFDTATSQEGYDYYPEGITLLKNEKSLYVATNGSKSDWARYGVSKVLGNWVQKKQYKLMFMKPNQKDLNDLALWARDGKLKCIIDSQYQFNKEGIQQAFDKLESRRAVGKIIINLK